MGFASSGLLPLTALALIPLVIHLLSRLRLKRVAFPSLLLLQSVRRERFSWVRMKEILLLILRTIALLSLLLALARPFVRARLPGLGQARDLVLLVDDSYSMSAGNRRQDALEAARGYVAGLAQSGRVLLMTTSGSAPDTQFVSPRAALTALQSAAPSGRADLLNPALGLAAERAGKAGARLVVITDLQRRAMPDSWPRLSPAPVVHDAGTQQVENVGVSGLTMLPGAATVAVEVTNFGTRPARRTLTLAGDVRVLELPAGGREVIEFAPQLPSAGPGLISAGLGRDSLAIDDTRYLVVPEHGLARVLLVESSDTVSYLRRALSADSSAGLELHAVSPSAFGRQNLERYDIVIVADPAALKPADWNRFDFFLRAGGAGWLFLDAGARPEGRPAYARSSGPARPSSGFFSVREPGVAHPLTAALGHAGWKDVHVWQHAVLNSADLRPVVLLSDNGPLVAEHTELNLLVWSVEPLPEFTDLPFRALFPALVHQTLGYLAGRSSETGLQCGDTIVLRLRSSAPVTVTTPTGRKVVEPGIRLGRPVLEYADAGEPGFYRVDVEGETWQLAVNTAPEEGNLTRADPALLRAAGVSVNSGRAGESDLTAPLLWLAALAFVLEMLVLLV